MHRGTTQNLKHQNGSSLLDTIAATVLTVLIIVPCARIMQDGLQLDRRLQLRQDMMAECTSLLEKELAFQSLSFRSRRKGGQLKLTNARLGFQIVSSDKAAFGGRPGRLMGIHATVWHDMDGDRRKDSGEPEVSYYSSTVSPTILTSLKEKSL